MAWNTLPLIVWSAQREEKRGQLRTWHDANGESLPGQYNVPVEALPTTNPAATSR